jgi:Methyltransferase domain
VGVGGGVLFADRRARVLSDGGADELDSRRVKPERHRWETVVRPCPLCGDDRIQTSFIGSRPPAETLSDDEIAQLWSGLFKRRIFFTYRRCASCGLSYCPDFLDPARLSLLYEHMTDNTGGLPLAGLERTQRRYADILLRRVQGGFAYIELGPDIGLLTRRVVDVARPPAVFLYEPNIDVWPQLRAAAGAAECSLLAAVHGFVDVPSGAVGAAAMVHVLDHAISPTELLRDLRRTLLPRAPVLVVTHDEHSLLARALGGRWPPRHPQHPQLYSKATMARQLEIAGFEVVEQRKTFNDFPVGYLLKHTLSVVGLPHAWLSVDAGPSLPVKLGNIATVAVVR